MGKQGRGRGTSEGCGRGGAEGSPGAVPGLRFPRQHRVQQPGSCCRVRRVLRDREPRVKEPRSSTREKLGVGRVEGALQRPVQGQGGRGEKPHSAQAPGLGWGAAA